MLRLFGIDNCDRCRAARRWLAEQDIEVRFTDLKTEPPDSRRIRRWAEAAGWETLLNRRSRTWRALPEDQRDELDGVRAVNLMAASPLLIRRPVIEAGSQIHVGFSPAKYTAIFAGAD